MIDFVEMKCKYCGGQLTAKDQTHVHCPYCGKNYMIDTGSPDKIVNVYHAQSSQNTGRFGSVILLIILGVIFIFSLIMWAVFSAASSEALQKADSFITPSPAFSETAAEEMPAFSPLFEAFFMDAFGKSGAEVTEKELSSIRYFSLADKGDFTSVSYSTETPDADGVPETIRTLTFSGDIGSSLDDLSRLEGLVSIDIGSS